MSRIRWTGQAAGTTAGILTDAEAQRTNKALWHAYVSFTGTAPTSVQIQYSPEIQGVSDGTAQWFAPTQLLFTAAGDTAFFANTRRFRVVVVGGDGTTNVTVEVR